MNQLFYLGRLCVCEVFFSVKAKVFCIVSTNIFENFLPLKFMKRSWRRDCSTFHEQKGLQFKLTARSLNPLNYHNGFCLSGMQVSYFYRHFTDILMWKGVNKQIFWNRSTWTYIAEKLICRSYWAMLDINKSHIQTKIWFPPWRGPRLYHKDQ